MYQKVKLFFVILIFLTTEILCEDNSSATTKDYDQYVTDESVAFNTDEYQCLRFTWLGPGFDNSSQVNGTCDDLAQKYKLKDTPCKQPLVITYDGSPPNMTYLWENHQDNILCRKASGQSCIKYSYTFNNELQNLTYMCAKAIAVGEGPIKRNICYSQSVNGYVVKVCVCQPHKNSYYPCFYSGAHQMSASVLTVVASWYVLLHVGTRWWNMY